MYPKIKTRQKLLSTSRKLSDKEIVENFIDEIDIPPTLAEQSSSQFFNSIIRNLSKKTKNTICSS